MIDISKLTVQQKDIDNIGIVKREANNGNAEYQYILGVMYLKGIPVFQNYAKAKKWITLAAENGNKDALAIVNDLHDIEGAPTTPISQPVETKELGISTIDDEGIHWLREDPKKLNLSYYGKLGSAEKAIRYGSYLSFVLGVFNIFPYLADSNFMAATFELLFLIPFCAVGIIGANSMQYRKPNAVFNCLVYSWVCTISNAFSIITNVANGKFPGILVIMWLVFGITIICYLHGSDEVKKVYPKELRATTTLDKILAGICIAFTALVCWGLML